MNENENPPMDPLDREAFDKLAARCRYIVTDIICRAGGGHIGGSLSLVEILIALYYHIMQTHPEDPDWEDRDRLVFSKGHAGPALYTVLALKGFFPKSWLTTLNADGTRLPSHADQNQTPGVDMTTGSLGQGLSCACGMALAARMNAKDHRIFCLIGDGESNEGQNWEAALFAAHNKLDNLVAICDYNKLQVDGFTKDILDLDPLADKWRAFGWEALEMDGHDGDDICETLRSAVAVKGKPTMIIAHTVKGKGHTAIENTIASHNIKVTDKQTHERVLDGLAVKDIEVEY